MLDSDLTTIFSDVYPKWAGGLETATWFGSKAARLSTGARSLNLEQTS